MAYILRALYDGVMCTERRLGDSSYRLTAIRILAAQALVTVAAALGMYVWSGPRGALSALTGGMICVLSGAYLAQRMFRFKPDRPPAQFVRAFYVGEAVKLALTALMFLIAIVYMDVDILIVILTYMAALSMYWFALLATARGMS